MQKLIAALKEFSAKQTGAAVIEYAILGLLLAAAGILALKLLGERIAVLFTDVTGAL